ncbi:MAG: hypothetical protein E7388_02455 [Ruminococcaceae bacterium]|nr:hypothetical protein [Oscillospiraceae bacterium]
MELKAGYHFFQDGGLPPVLHQSKGFVFIRHVKSFIKIQCVVEHLSFEVGQFVSLCLWDSLNIEEPFILGKIFLSKTPHGLKGFLDTSFQDGGLPPVLKFDGFAVMNSNNEIILHTQIPKKEKKEPMGSNHSFDPFKTTNPSYSWGKVETLAALKSTLAEENIVPFPEIVKEIKLAFPKYHHILTGLYAPTEIQKKYFILGIPGTRPQSVGNQLFRWINKCVSLEEYPYFDGYKLYYFDKKTGAIVKTILRT